MSAQPRALQRGLLTVAPVVFAVALAACHTGRTSPSPGGYIVSPHVLIHTRDGATLSAVVVRRRNAVVKLPAALVFTIYADPQKNAKDLEYAVDRGYVGVTAYSRGKGYSPQTIAPYEFDGRDADSVIAWIVKQPWSDGRVGMYGGSYNGFTQWAAAKRAPAALRTIVPIVAENPGDGLPVQCNVFLPVNYAWIYYVTDNKFLDKTAYDDPRFGSLNERWYRSGRSYRDIDAIAGIPNPWLRKWLQHPSYDGYWQSMVPYRFDFARINIPVLTITGYYDDGQVSALWYFRNHHAFNNRAQDYLVIGPWDHFGAERATKDTVLRGYRIDSVAQIDTPKLVFDWFDYVMKGEPEPELVKDRVNYEVMGSNAWRHASSIETMGTSERLYLTSRKIDATHYLLSPTKPSTVGVLRQAVNFRDRNSTNNDSYPYLIVGKKPNLSNGFLFMTNPFTTTVEVSGFDGVVRAIVNKRDMDVGLVLYQVLPDGRLFQLSYFTGRASYAADMSRRTLLVAGVEAKIPINQATLFSRRIQKGSRLLVTLNVNKNPFAEINYGTGGDVATENVRNAKEPLEVRWLTNSYVGIRIAN